MTEARGLPWSVLWEIAQVSGAAAIVAALVLCVLPVRPRASGPAPLALHRHAQVGWLALAAGALHVVFLLGADRRVLEHLRLSTPLYEWAGIFALVLLLALTVPSSSALRQRLWVRHRNFQALHVTLTAALLAAIAAHVVTTGRYLHGHVRGAAYAAISVAALLALLRPRLRAVPGPRRFMERLVFGRHARLVLAAVVLSALAIVALLPGGLSLVLREGLVRRTTALRVDFPHDKHGVINCLRCHHDFTDHSGPGTCIGCHRSDRRDLRVRLEARFHDFCLGCHRDPPPGVARHGPTTGCETCHAVPSS